MDTANRAVRERRLRWQDPLGQWQRSNMTQVAYCRQQDLDRVQCGDWEKQLLAARAPSAATGVLPGLLTVQRASVRATLVRGADYAYSAFTRPTTPHHPFNNPINLYFR